LQDFTDIDLLQVSALHEALLLLPETDDGKAKCLTLLGDIFSKQHTSEQLNDIERAIRLYKDALEAAEEKHCIDSNHFIDLWEGLQVERLLEERGGILSLRVRSPARTIVITLTF
jgi:putative NADH-flavin reductase